MKTRWIVIAGAMLVLTGCGGGGDDSATETPAPIETPPTSEAPPADLSAATLTVPTGFDFSTSGKLALQVSLNSSFPEKLYLTVCRELPAGAGPDLEQCMVRAPVANGLYQGELQLPNDVDSLTATIWGYDPAGVVKTVQWDRATSATGTLLISE